MQPVQAALACVAVAKDLLLLRNRRQYVSEANFSKTSF